MLLAAHTPAGERQPLQPLPAINPGFNELRESLLFPPDGGGSWELRIDDEPLALASGAWHWQPGFFAGEVRAQLLTAGKLVAEYRLDVAPDERKLGRARFESMLDELLAEDPLLVVGDEPATLLAGNELRARDPLSALLGFARMRIHGPRFVHALHEAARQPRLTVRLRRAEEPPHRVRRVDVASLRSLARTGGLETSRPIRVDVPVAEPHADGAANRAVVALMHLVRRRLRLLQEELPRVGTKNEGSARTSMAARLATRMGFLQRLDVDLTRLLRAWPWKDVTRAELSAAGLNALAADPLYARVYQMAWRALRLGAGTDSPEDRLWLVPTWEIFERWCFVRLARMLRELLPALVWTRMGTGKHPSGAEAAWAGSDGPRSVHLLLQPTFRRWDLSSRWGFKSISGERVPDLVVAWEERDGRRGFFVLDAKYRVSLESVLDAMASAHIYRDALRWHGAPPRFALLLLPAEGGAPWLAEPDFHRREGVGAAQIGDTLLELIRAMVAVDLPTPG